MTVISKNKKVRIAVNNSGMCDCAIAKEIEANRWLSGNHVILVDDRFGTGDFFVDWEPAPDGITVNDMGSDWNVLVRIKNN